MAIKFGADGTLYCNTVKYNRKNARNMIADGSYGNISGTQVWAGAVASTSPAGYKAYRSFKITSTTTYQKLPAITANHKYYLSFRYMKSDSVQLKIMLGDIGGDRGMSTTSSTGGAWVKYSYLWTPTASFSKNTATIYMYKNSTTGDYANQFILIDLTDTFGAGNEPDKTWCDANIREQEVFCNFSNLSNNVTYSNYNSRYTYSQTNGGGYYNYLQLDSNWEPREYMIYWKGSSSYNEAFITSASTFTLNTSNTFYMYYEQQADSSILESYGLSSDLYFPIAEPLMAQVKMFPNSAYCGGGGMREWKRVSAFGKRTQFTNGNYAIRLDFNNLKRALNIRATAINLLNATTLINQYNTYNGTSITINDINQEWCDRWIDGRSSPIIHINDNRNTQIKFNTDYDIVCNDIEIRPEINKITFKDNGTIVCKKLVRDRNY